MLHNINFPPLSGITLGSFFVTRQDQTCIRVTFSSLTETWSAKVNMVFLAVYVWIIAKDISLS